MTYDMHDDGRRKGFHEHNDGTFAWILTVFGREASEKRVQPSFRHRPQMMRETFR